MTQMFVYGIAAIVVSVGAALFARQRRAEFGAIAALRSRSRLFSCDPGHITSKPLTCHEPLAP